MGLQLFSHGRLPGRTPRKWALLELAVPGALSRKKCAWAYVVDDGFFGVVLNGPPDPEFLIIRASWRLGKSNIGKA